MLENWELEWRNWKRLLGESISEPKWLINWSKDAALIQNLCETDIYNYHVLEKGARHQHKSDRSSWYVADHHVHNVEYNQISEDYSHCMVRCEMIPSIPKKNDPDSVVWVCLSQVTGKVLQIVVAQPGKLTSFIPECSIHRHSCLCNYYTCVLHPSSAPMMPQSHTHIHLHTHFAFDTTAL